MCVYVRVCVHVCAHLADTNITRSSCSPLTHPTFPHPSLLQHAQKQERQRKQEQLRKYAKQLQDEEARRVLEMKHEADMAAQQRREQMEAHEKQRVRFKGRKLCVCEV